MAKLHGLQIAGYSVSSAWAQWFLSMALGASVTWGLLQSRLSALETDSITVKSELTEIRSDVREIRTYLLGKK